MQDVDRPAQIQTLSKPSRARGPRVEMKCLRIVLGFERADRISGHLCSGRHVRQEPPVGSSELKRAIGTVIDLETLLVDCAMVAATQQCEIRERRRAAGGPVAHVMALTQRQLTTWKAAAAVAM